MAGSSHAEAARGWAACWRAGTVQVVDLVVNLDVSDGVQLAADTLAALGGFLVEHSPMATVVDLSAQPAVLHAVHSLCEACIVGVAASARESRLAKGMEDAFAGVVYRVGLLYKHDWATEFEGAVGRCLG